jgi:hypothetical protein
MEFSKVSIWRCLGTEAWRRTLASVFAAVAAASAAATCSLQLLPAASKAASAAEAAETALAASVTVFLHRFCDSQPGSKSTLRCIVINTSVSPAQPPLR